MQGRQFTSMILTVSAFCFLITAAIDPVTTIQNVTTAQYPLPAWTLRATAEATTTALSTTPSGATVPSTTPPPTSDPVTTTQNVTTAKYTLPAWMLLTTTEATTTALSTTPSEAPSPECIRCLRLGARAIQDLEDFTSAQPTVAHAAGVKICKDMRTAYQCSQLCDTNPDQNFTQPATYKKLEDLLYRYCEGNATDGKMCIRCLWLGARAIQDFEDFTYNLEYQRQRTIYRAWQTVAHAAGVKICEDMRTAFQCSQYCDTKPDYNFTQAATFKKLEDLLYRYCEGNATDGKTCRLADTRECDRVHDKNDCTRGKSNYDACVENVLEFNGLDCSGVCTPARRYFHTQAFQSLARCSLNFTSSNGTVCYTFLSRFCFEPFKSSPDYWEKFELLHEDETTQNLADYCKVLKGTENCINEAVISNINYTDFKADKPCRSNVPQLYLVKMKWFEMINPLCDAGLSKAALELPRYINDVCGAPPATEPPPTTAITTTPTATTKPSGKRKIKRRRRPGNGSDLTRYHSCSLIAVLCLLIRLG